MPRRSGVDGTAAADSLDARCSTRVASSRGCTADGPGHHPGCYEHELTSRPASSQQGTACCKEWSTKQQCQHKITLPAALSPKPKKPSPADELCPRAGSAFCSYLG